MRSGYLFWLAIILHVMFWGVFLRHLPFFRVPLGFLDLDTYLSLWRDVFSGVNLYRVSYMTTLGPPLVMLPFLPFVFLPQAWGQFIFFLLNVFCGFALCRELVISYGRSNFVLWLFASLLLFSSFPVRFSLLMGQPALIIAYLLTLLILRPEKRIVILALIILKTFFVGLLLPFVSQKLLIVQAVFTLAAIAFAFSPLLPFGWYDYYLKNSFVKTISVNQSLVSSDYYNQSLKSTLHRFRADVLFFPILLVTLLIVGVLVIHSRSVALSILLSIFSSPIVWQHYMVFLFPVLGYFFAKTSDIRKRLLLILIFLLISSQFSVLHEVRITALTAITASHMFMGMSLLLGYSCFETLDKTRETQHLQTQ